MRVEAIAFTQVGLSLGERLCEPLRVEGHEVTLCSGRRVGTHVGVWTREKFPCAEALLFIGAVGIAVRSIAPHVRSKATDPAVLVIDEGGQYVIPLLSGHMGGANALAKLLATSIKALPIITTATDLRGVFAVDNWACEQGLAIVNPERIVEISSALLDGKRVTLYSEWPIAGEAPAGVDVVHAKCGAQIVLSLQGPSDASALWLVPRAIAVGIGCRRGTEENTVARAVDAALARHEIPTAALRQVCSIDLKGDEAGLLAFCHAHTLPFTTFSAQELCAVSGEFTPSAFVREVTGVDNVCERSAVLGSGGTLLSCKEASEGVTVALAISPILLVFPNKEAL